MAGYTNKSRMRAKQTRQLKNTLRQMQYEKRLSESIARRKAQQMTDNMIDGTAALAITEQPASNIEIFPTELSQVQQLIINAVQRNAAIEEVRRNMVAGLHYGNIPGVKKPSLSKAGAEFINDVYGFRPHYDLTEKVYDWDTGLFYFQYRCTLIHRASNIVVGEGLGNCSTRESKYWYRTGKRLCPKCEQPTLMRSKYPPRNKPGAKKGWYCRNDECNTSFDYQTGSIMSQNPVRVKNDDIFDLPNTVDKMAQKRAYVAATLSATNASQFFTQDLEDRHDNIMDAIILDDPDPQPHDPKLSILKPAQPPKHDEHWATVKSNRALLVDMFHDLTGTDRPAPETWETMKALAGKHVTEYTEGKAFFADVKAAYDRKQASSDAGTLFDQTPPPEDKAEFFFDDDPELQGDDDLDKLPAPPPHDSPFSSKS